MTVSETLNSDVSTLDSALAGRTVDAGFDCECEARTEETEPRTSPDTEPQHMDEKLAAEGAPEDGGPAPDFTGVDAVKGPAPGTEPEERVPS